MANSILMKDSFKYSNLSGPKIARRVDRFSPVKSTGEKEQLLALLAQ
jgi:hypothetical protein